VKVEVRADAQGVVAHAGSLLGRVELEGVFGLYE
jgi:hypothetical protein